MNSFPSARTTLALAAVLLGLGSPLSAQAHEKINTDSLNVMAAVQRFHASLARGDSAAVLSLLSQDVVILESGGVERRAAYRKEHLPADIAFARAVTESRSLTSATVVGDAAWVSATTTTTGTFNGRAVNSVGAELLVLTRVKTKAGRGTWLIRAVHWSSRRRS